MSQPSPFFSPLMDVEKDWIDYNGHLNMAFYAVLFDRCVDNLWDKIGFGEAYHEGTGCTTYVAEYRVRYIREIHQGDRIRASWRLLAHDDKSWHFCQELIHEDGWVSATGEGVGLHIDTSGPRVVAMPAPIQTRFQSFFEDHDKLPRPDWVGRPMGIRRKGLGLPSIPKSGQKNKDVTEIACYSSSN